MKTKPRVTVGMHNGRPVLFWNGEPYAYTAPFTAIWETDAEGRRRKYADRERFVQAMRDFYRPYAEQGFHGYQAHVSIGWSGPGQWDPVNLNVADGYWVDETMRAALEVDPEARIMVQMKLLMPPNAWAEAFPDELEQDDRGERYGASIASDRFREEQLAHVASFIRHVEEGPYAEHVLSYFCYYLHEGFTLSCMSNGVTDFSPAMRNCFRGWLRERYGGDVAALRDAWRDPAITFDSTGVPTREEQLYADLGWFRDPTGPRKVLDYIECRVDRFVENYYRLARTIKETCDGRVPLYFYGGYLQVAGWPGCYWDDRGMTEQEFNPHATSVQTGWRRIFECPDIDGWESPYDYFYRQVGGVCLNQSLEESMKLRGKLFQVNEDTRTHYGWKDALYGVVETPEETMAVLRRNFGAIASHWSGGNWNDQGGDWYTEGPIMKQLGEFNRLLQRSLEWPESPVDAIGVFIDEESLRYEKPLIDLDWDLIYKQRIFGLSHCGVPFRVHLLDDLALANMPDYKCNLFLNAFYLNPERQALVHNAMQRDGKTAVWMIAPGFCHQTEGLSLASMERLTGMEFAKYDAAWEAWTTLSNFTHPITSGLPHDLTYGSNIRLGPSFYVDDPAATTLGKRLLFQGRHEPALAVKEFGKYRSIYSASPLLPADLLRGIARYAGCHVYTEENDVVMAGRGLITYHTAAPGPRTVTLPEPATVYDIFSGEKLAEECRAFTLDFTAPGTRVLTILPPELWRRWQGK
ncbi:MAG: hypothetical protein ACYC7E_22485 [Armatimonadota bacterium]